MVSDQSLGPANSGLIVKKNVTMVGLCVEEESAYCMANRKQKEYKESLWHNIVPKDRHPAELFRIASFHLLKFPDPSKIA